MLTPPDGLSEQTLAESLRRHWDVTVRSLEYRAVGFGSHHWQVMTDDGQRWFTSVDQLSEPTDRAWRGLHAALTTATDLRDAGADFVVAPELTTTGQSVARIDDTFAVALYPYMEGQSFEFGAFIDEAHRRATLDMIVRLHSTPPASTPHIAADDFALPHRHLMSAAVQSDRPPADTGPYSRPLRELLSANAHRLAIQLQHYDDLVAAATAGTSAMVVTHGEPHPGNTMQTQTGWVLIDWDTVLSAPPERDLWRLDGGDGGVLAAYLDATGRAPEQHLMDLYRVRWDLADLAEYMNWFSRPHTGSIDDDTSWGYVQALVAALPA